MYFTKTVAAAAAALSIGVSGAFAASVNPTANVVFIVDESGSMAGEQAFLRDTVIGGLDAGLSAAGVTNRSYGVVGFGAGGTGNLGRVLGSGLQDAAATATNLDNLVTTGSFEDGYSGIDFALNNFAFDAGAAINFILVTDEDRDNGNAMLDRVSIESALTSANILLNAVVSHTVDGDNTVAGTQTAIGVDADGNSYNADGSGGFVTNPNGELTTADFGSTRDDYSELALATGGAVWNLNILRNGGLDAASFAQAFIDIKVQEIVSQLPTDPTPTPTPAPVPLPAGLPLLLAGLGAFGFVRMRSTA